ncbi:MAG: rhomboid family intramembrane serine protease, partial [Actinobacteria bacterium]|nr:rhomboid family intramembrane serine protease [Actinomycetota bacterium]
INLVFTFVARGISWQAHIGGLLAGFLVMEVLQWFGRRSPRSSLTASQIAGLVGLAVLMVALIVWRIAAFPTF